MVGILLIVIVGSDLERGPNTGNKESLLTPRFLIPTSFTLHEEYCMEACWGATKGCRLPNHWRTAHNRP